ncbi:NADH-quinone oxidoreductase subunit NuoF family protein [Streptacidiphilus jiangxiensis]|uniref:NADH:ubiquinone oxidoreductase, NADH-binding subunit (Chain F) n=1 Tax=Streptacidiphilus jiangxiensis TaxID=235985 RepID=A0A1H7S7R6_STRJI|nr:NADH-quinone oxidoreductase subunit NuoF family protein [Streptacidiphilus jiangxiensis]SEL68533.1 NADH:ubiquinone oxidoreductase, NADH-binding subunit (chain F) [Streptacidiphilus jiangxiensis]
MSAGLAVTEVRRLGPARLSAGLDRWERLDLAAHERTHGPLPRVSQEALLALAERVDLRGRGGAAFPFARKAHAALAATQRGGQAPVLVVNATEGEPPSVKDATLLTRTPHLVLDGVSLAAAAFGAAEVVVAVAAGSPGELSVPAALDERARARRDQVPTRTVCVPERFVSGESGALVRAVNGRDAVPSTRPVRAAEGGRGGVRGRPTLLCNAETWAQLALLVRLGADGYAVVGTPEESGTLLVTVNRAGGRAPVVVEIPAGAPLGIVLDACGVDPGAGVLVGGYHGGWLRPEVAERTALSRAGLTAAGGVLGAASVAVLPQGVCALGELTRVAGWLAGESVGQCGPCRRGLPETAAALAALTRGSGSPEEVRHAAAQGRGRGACAHPDGTARFVLSGLTAFADEVTAHQQHGGCGRRPGTSLPLPEPAGTRLTLDWSRCDAHGLCASLAPDLLTLDPHGYPVFRTDAPIAPWQESQARRAVAGCPALALRLPRA